MKWILILSFLFVGCQTPPTPVTRDDTPIVVTPDHEPIKPVAFVGAWKNKAWDAELIKAIRSSKLLTTKVVDWKSFNFKQNIGTETEWAKIFVEMAKWESGYDTKKKYLEQTCSGWGPFRKCNTIRDRKGRIVTSRGLFQLSIESSNGGYNCGFKNEDAIHDPKQNISCAIKIMERWVVNDGAIHTTKSPWRGGARYWSVLRGNRDYTRKSLKAIQMANK